MKAAAVTQTGAEEAAAAGGGREAGVRAGVEAKGEVGVKGREEEDEERRNRCMQCTSRGRW